MQKHPLTENNFHWPHKNQLPVATQIPRVVPEEVRIYLDQSDLFSMPRNTNPSDDENINPTAVFPRVNFFVLHIL